MILHGGSLLLAVTSTGHVGVTRLRCDGKSIMEFGRPVKMYDVCFYFR